MKEIKRNLFFNVIGLIILCLVLSSVLTFPAFAENNESTTDLAEKDENNNLELFGLKTYYDYITLEHNSKNLIDKNINIDIFDFDKSDNMSAEVIEIGNRRAISTGDTGWIEWEFDANESGLYNISVEYYHLPDKRVHPERAVYINGIVPFKEAGVISFNRIYADELSEKKYDSKGNQIRPRQKEIFEWNQSVLKDRNGYYNENFLFYLTEGKNTLRFLSLKQKMAIGSIEIGNFSIQKSYDEYIESHKNNNVTGFSDKFQAEDAVKKSDVILYPIYDRTSTLTEPYNIKNIVLNTIGGEKWRSPGQKIAWEINIPKDGLYNITFRAKQNFKPDVISFRELRINDKIPFDEVSTIPFRYDSKWQMITLGDSEKNFSFFMKEGKNILSLEVVPGLNADFIRIIQDVVLDLNKAYQQILMYTGPAPDKNRDYRFEDRIPGVLEELKTQSEILEKVLYEFEDVTGEKGGDSATLENFVRQLKGMHEDPKTIPERFDSFRGNITAISAWVTSLRETPVEIDYIAVTSLDKTSELPEANSGFWQMLWHQIKGFMLSFSNEYNSIGDIDNNYKVIEVWVTTGRDQAQIIKDLSDNFFTEDYKISVDVKLIAPAMLMPAIFTGIPPEVILQQGSGICVEWGTRGALADLNRFDEIDTILENFRESALVPLSFDNKLYGLPEVQTFVMLYYRKDILKELNLDIPRTWQDVYNMIPVLQKRYMTFGIPLDLGTFSTILFQNGGRIFSDDFKSVALDEEIAIKSFEQFTSFYTRYSFPITYDFANRFRTGQTPIGIADLGEYNRLTLLAPEIEGMWGFEPIPGTLKPDGTIDRTVNSSPALAAVIPQEGKDTESGWEFLKWWVSSDTQILYAQEIEALQGLSARYYSANIKAFETLPWPSADLEKLSYQAEFTKTAPNIVGAYMFHRHFENAYRSVMLQNTEPRDTLLNYIDYMNAEILEKRKHLGFD